MSSSVDITRQDTATVNGPEHLEQLATTQPPTNGRPGDRAINFLLRLPAACVMRARILWYRLLGMQIAGRCWIRRIDVPRNPFDIRITAAALDDHVVLLTTGARRSQPRIVIGAGTYINRFTMIDASERVEIGNRCMIGPFCYITDHDHGTAAGVAVADQQLVSQPVSIGDDAWIGAGVRILKGVQIGAGAIVGAGAVVTRDVPPCGKAYGVPARVVGVRQ